MGEVIYLNPKSERFYREFEQQVRETLGLLGDEKSAPWVVATIKRLLEMPELFFSFKVDMPVGLSTDTIRAIDDQYAKAFHEFAENLKCGMVREFISSYVDRVKG